MKQLATLVINDKVSRILIITPIQLSNTFSRNYWPLSILGIGHLDAHSHFQAMLEQARLWEVKKKWWPEKEKEKEIRKKKSKEKNL